MTKAIVELNWNFKVEFENLFEAVEFAETALEHSDNNSIELKIEKIQDQNEDVQVPKFLEEDPVESEVIEDESGDTEAI